MSTPATTARLTWLHFSDIHLSERHSWAQDVVLKSLAASVKDRYAGTNRPDLLFLTGDIAFSGQPKEYAFAEDFVRRLCGSIGLDLSRVCMIPGNHDVNIRCAEDAFVGARTVLTDADAVDSFFGNEGRRALLFLRQAAYRDFANRIYAGTSTQYSHTSYAHTRLITVGSIRARVLLLDSTWLAEGGQADAMGVLLGERQILDACTASPSDEGSFTFALMHHPFAWLREFEQSPIENLLLANAQICLRGHVHSQDLKALEALEKRMTTFTAGAVYQSRQSDNSYMWCSLDLSTGMGERVVHRFNPAQKTWDASEKTAWRLLAEPPVVAATTARAEVTSIGCSFPSYVSCLLAGLKSEVPVKLPGRTTDYVAIGAALEGVGNPCGDLVTRLRHHFHWRPVWLPEQWTHHLSELLAELDASFLSLGESLATELSAREERCRALLEAMLGQAPSSSACNEVRHLLATQDLPRARSVLERWLGEDVVTADERLDLLRLEVHLLRAERRPADALGRSEALIAGDRSIAQDLVLAATCAHEARDLTKATVWINAALDAGAEPERVRPLAFQIAGASGDKNLAERVRVRP